MIGIDRANVMVAVLIILMGCVAITAIAYVESLRNDCRTRGGVLVKGAFFYECLIVDGVKTWPK